MLSFKSIRESDLKLESRIQNVNGQMHRQMDALNGTKFESFIPHVVLYHLVKVQIKCLQVRVQKPKCCDRQTHRQIDPLMGLLHWGCLVGNYEFFEGREQCLHSIVFSRLVGVNQQNMFDMSQTYPDSVSGPWLHPPDNRPVVDLYNLSDTLPVLSYTVTILYGRTSRAVMAHNLLTGCRHKPTILERKPVCHKHYQPELVTLQFPSR